MSGDGPIIRPSRDEDVPAIAAIYAHHVLNGVASFEEVPPEAEEIARRSIECLRQALDAATASTRSAPLA